ncbi:hypothetical protein FQN50_002947 [Emmonsiellopsis sp. PD_5]|nr:hypothetical protein FQN50_002947 [Emmonsiellopsis sp. PD_5]
MGIPHLTRRLLPHAQSVTLGTTTTATSNHNSNENETNTANPAITTLIIDGPGLVYDIYYRLLSWADESRNPVDAQPSGDDVSVGVMLFLMGVRGCGVRVEKIYFDGGLPLSKRPTRLERMEKTRQKLESLCRETPGGFKAASVRRDTNRRVTARKVFERRQVPRRFKNLPENPFMMATVIEDLVRGRWTGAEVGRWGGGAVEGGEGDEENVFAGVAEIVPGEADMWCAEAAREYGAAVLTGDSDLLVHDLGPKGSVIFFDSIEAGSSSGDGIRATQLCPAAIASSLGVVSIQRLAYELKRDPHTSFANLIRHAKSTDGSVEKTASFIAFMKEYNTTTPLLPPTAPSPTGTSISHTHTDPKLSELHTQYTYTSNPLLSHPHEPPHIYLPILTESHDRRTAWTHGSSIRLMAYSLLNNHQPPASRHETVLEHIRKGRRIAQTPLPLLSPRDLARKLQAFVSLVNSIITSHHDNECKNNMIIWKSLALHEILSHMAAADRPSPGRLRRFLARDYCGEKLEWEDIHLHAQMGAVVYSVRLLGEVVAIVDGDGDGDGVEGGLDEVVREVGRVLNTGLFPPLRVAGVMRGWVGGADVVRIVDGVFGLLGDGEADEGDEDGDEQEQQQADIPPNENNSEESSSWTTTLPGKQRQRKRKTSDVSAAPVQAKQLRGKEKQKQGVQGNNMFDLLPMEG